MRTFGRGVAADNPHVTTVESEILTPAGRRWVERVQRPLDVLAVIFLIDVILIWSFPDATADSQAPLLDRLDDLPPSRTRFAPH